MRTFPQLMLAVICLIGTASVAAAQDTSGAHGRRRPAIVRWITEPTAIALTPAQRTEFDSLKARFVLESDKVRTEGKGGDMAVVFKMRDLTRKYQKMVRDILTADQQAVFDKNIRVATVRR